MAGSRRRGAACSARAPAAAGLPRRPGPSTGAGRRGLRGPAAPAPAAAATWSRRDLRLSAGTNPRTGDWELDGVAQTSIASAGTASTVSRLRLGSAVAADAYTANFDDAM